MRENEYLLLPANKGVARGIAAELLYRYSGITQREIGELLGRIDYTGVSMLRYRLKERMADDGAVRAKYAKAERCLRNYCEDLTPLPVYDTILTISSSLCLYNYQLECDRSRQHLLTFFRSRLHHPNR